MSRKPANERASERVRIGAPATLKWGEQETTGFVEVVNVAGMYVATSRSPRIGDYVELVFFDGRPLAGRNLVDIDTLRLQAAHAHRRGRGQQLQHIANLCGSAPNGSRDNGSLSGRGKCPVDWKPESRIMVRPQG